MTKKKKKRLHSLLNIQDCLKSRIDRLWTGRVAVYVGRVVMVHTHPDILITLCVVLLDGGIFFLLGSMGYSKVAKSMSIALNHLWISYHHNMCLWCGYGVSACLDASICVSYSDISVSNMIKHRPFLLLHLKQNKTKSVSKRPIIQKDSTAEGQCALEESLAEFYQFKLGEICAEMRYCLVALESLTCSTSSDRKQLAQTSTKQPGSRSGRWMIYKCQFRAVIVSKCVETGNWVQWIESRSCSLFFSQTLLFLKSARIFTTLHEEKKKSHSSHICLHHTYYSLLDSIINYKGKSALNVNSD